FVHSQKTNAPSPCPLPEYRERKILRKTRGFGKVSGRQPGVPGEGIRRRAKSSDESVLQTSLRLGKILGEPALRFGQIIMGHAVPPMILFEGQLRPATPEDLYETLDLRDRSHRVHCPGFDEDWLVVELRRLIRYQRHHWPN